jgi:hypothetical protein
VDEAPLELRLDAAEQQVVDDAVAKSAAKTSRGLAPSVTKQMDVPGR